MKDYIKLIRLQANMSQEQFAKAIGTTVITINRWENGKTTPNKIAQKQLYEFCKEHKINLVDMIIDRKSHPGEDQKVVLYHGSKKGIQGQIAPISREQ